MTPRKANGFSLIELLIVVAIILIIAAIAIPNFLKSKMTANEASGAQSIRTVTTGETTYSAMCPNIGYSATLIELNTGALCVGAQNIIDDALASGTKSGYKFTFNSVVDPTGIRSSFTIIGLPGVVGVTGQRGLGSDESGLIRYTTDGTAPTFGAGGSSALQ
jgi:prepilin-type N-terminal cleavage/methylation domain-containing protein